MSSFFRLLSIFSQFIEFFSICLRFSRDFSQSFFLKCSFSNLLRVSNFFDFIQVFRPFVNVLRASLSSHTRKEAFESVECDEFSASSMIRTQWARGGQWGNFFFEELWLKINWELSKCQENRDCLKINDVIKCVYVRKVQVTIKILIFGIFCATFSQCNAYLDYALILNLQIL